MNNGTDIKDQWRVYIDGGCTHNNVKDTSKRRAGCGVYVDGYPSPYPIAPTESDIDRVPETNHQCRYVCERLPNTNAQPATNNRAELLGVIRALELLVAGCLPPRPGDTVTFVNDSKYVYSAVTDWLPRLWRPNNYQRSSGGEVLNADLVKRLDRLLLYLGQERRYSVLWVHVNSHRKEPKDHSTPEWRDWHGNDQADRLATLACTKALNE